MFIHHTFKTPLKKKSQSMNYETTENLQPNTEKSKNRQIIDELFHNFTSLNSTIEVDGTKNNFNLIEYEKQDEKIKYDPQIMTAKLRRLQNQAEINRIQFELQQRRKKKKSHSNYGKFKSDSNEFQNSTYQQTYQSFLKNNKLIDMPQNDSESEEDETTGQKPKGISRFHQLKKHSKILEYTMKKLQEREERTGRQLKECQDRKENLKNVTNQLKDYGEFADIIIGKKSSNNSHTVNTEQVNPETIIEDKFKRIMTMKANDKVSDQVKSNPRCTKMMNVQNDILLELEEEHKNLSKDNAKKLKSRFIQIVNQLSKGDKKRKENKFLPSIDTTSFPAHNTAINTARPSLDISATINISKTICVKRYQKTSSLGQRSSVASRFGSQQV